MNLEKKITFVSELLDRNLEVGAKLMDFNCSDKWIFHYVDTSDLEKTQEKIFNTLKDFFNQIGHQEFLFLIEIEQLFKQKESLDLLEDVLEKTFTKNFLDNFKKQKEVLEESNKFKNNILQINKKSGLKIL